MSEAGSGQEHGLPNDAKRCRVPPPLAPITSSGAGATSPSTRRVAAASSATRASTASAGSP